MKHILNNLTEEEKNSIRKQHKDAILIETAKFKKLLSSSRGDVRPIVEGVSLSQITTEQEMIDAIEKSGCWDPKSYPVISNLVGTSFAAVGAIVCGYATATSSVATAASGGLTGFITVATGWCTYSATKRWVSGMIKGYKFGTDPNRPIEKEAKKLYHCIFD
jgi:hypothetical protein